MSGMEECINHMIRSLMSSPQVPVFKPFILALIQLGHIGTDKSANLKHAREMILKAAAPEKKSRPDLVVLPVCRCSCAISVVCLSQSIRSQECFNSPYDHTHFPVYAENIAFTAGQPYDISKSESESVKMLASAAKEAGIWLIGGIHILRLLVKDIILRYLPGSIPERDIADDNVYNTCTVYNPQGLASFHHCQPMT
jgi:omega-amidase